MKRLLLAIVLVLSWAGLASAQNVSVTGNVQNLTGTTPDASSFVRFVLKGFTGTVPKVNGTAVLLPGCGQANTLCQDFIPVNGTVSGTIYGNDVITPTGTFYTVQFWTKGRTLFSCDYNVTGPTFNINSAACLTTPNIAPGNILGAKTFSCPLVATTSATCIHNFGVTNNIVECFDGNNKLLWPDTITSTDVNTSVITFTSAQTGNCTIINGGNVALTTAPANAVVTNPNSTQVISGAPLTVQNALNAMGGGSLIGTFTGPTVLPAINSVLYAAGMKCDGSTDDTSAFAATIASASNPTRVIVPKGTCILRSNTGITDGIWLQGAGANATTLQLKPSSNDSAHSMLTLSGTTGNVTLSDITLDGNKSLQSSGNCIVGNSQTGDMQGFRSFNVTYTNGYQGAICFTVPAGHLVRDFDIFDNTFLSNSVATTQFQDQIGGWGDISIRAPYGGRIHHNNSTSAQSDFIIFGTNGINPVGHVVIDGNIVTGAMGFGVALGGGGGFGTDDVINGNYFNMPNSRENIIDVANWNNNLVTNNQIYWGTCTFCSGIGDGPPSSGTNIQGNTLVANFAQVTPGLCIGNGGDVNISNNFCYGGGIGLQLAANTVVDGAVVEGNTVINARTGNPGFQTLLSGGSSLSNVIIKGNHFYDNQTPHTQTYGIEIGAQGATTGYSNFTIEGNDVRNNLNGGIHIALPSFPSGFIIRGNPGYDPMSDNPYDIIASGNISQTSIFTTPTIDTFAYTVFITGGITTAATTSTAPNVNITYTDADSVARTVTVTPVAPTGNTRAGTYYNAAVPIYAAAGTTIGVNTSGYASSPGGTMQYSLHIRLRREN